MWWRGGPWRFVITVFGRGGRFQGRWTRHHVEVTQPCQDRRTYRTWGEVRADFINQTGTDSGVGSNGACVW